MVYFDHIASTPMHPFVLEAMLPYFNEHFGNPQSIHSLGQKSLQAIEKTREEVARLINSQPSEILFTSSGSESNNFALKGVASANSNKGNHIIVSSIEHQSVLRPASKLEKQGFKLSYVPVDKYGLVDPDDVKKALTPQTILVSVMFANSEVGTIEPIREISAICQENDVVFHTDAVAAAGNIPVDVNSLGVDLLSLSGNQFYGPSGCAALYVKKGTKIDSLIDGGIQENGKRAGTENVAGIVGLGTAAKLALKQMEQRNQQLITLRDKLIKELPEQVDHVVLTGHRKNRLPYHASFCIKFVEGESMLLGLDMQGVEVSSGSACTSKTLKVSHVLQAMGIDAAVAQGSIVFSLIEGTTPEDIDYLLEVFPPIIEKLRKMSPLYTKYLEEKHNDI